VKNGRRSAAAGGGRLGTAPGWQNSNARRRRRDNRRVGSVVARHRYRWALAQAKWRMTAASALTAGGRRARRHRSAGIASLGGSARNSGAARSESDRLRHDDYAALPPLRLHCLTRRDDACVALVYAALRCAGVLSLFIKTSAC